MADIRTRRLAALTALAGMVVALGVAGCSAGQQSDSGSTSNAKAPAVEPADGVAGARADEQAQPAQAGPAKDQTTNQTRDQAKPAEVQTPDKVQPAERSIIYTGSITVRVNDVNAAAAKITALAAGSTGFVGGDQRTIDADRSQATLVIRVPASHFATILDAIHGVGREENRSIQTQDVTEQVADVQSRIATAQASVDRVRALLARAQTIGDIVSLESELSRREADLESLQGRMRKLEDLTSLSTITVVLLGPAAKKAKPKKESSTGFMAGLKGGWHAFLGSLRVLLTIAGALLPWLLLVGVPVLALVWVLRRFRRSGAPTPGATSGVPASRTPAPEDPRSPSPAQPQPAARD